MKEKYFTPENLTDKANQIKSEARKVFNSRQDSFDKENCALLVLDMQKFFGKSSSHAFIPSFDVIIPGVIRLINGFKQKNLPVIATKHINTPENAGMMGKWWKDTITKESEYSEIVDEIGLTGVTVIKKSQYDAFYNTDLERILVDLKVKTLIITGVMTHLCCESTARSAFVRGFKTFFVVDATATYNEQFHRNSVVNLAHGFSVPVLSGKIAEKLDG